MSIHDLLANARQLKASDLHLSAGLHPKVRVNGDLIDIADSAVLSNDQLQSMVDELLPEIYRDEFIRDKEIDFAYSSEQLGRFRINIFQQLRGLSLVIRVIPNELPSLEQLGLNSTLQRLCSLQQGLILVTGATGSGKSTTLAAMVDFINTTMRKHILTLEDPIEFLHSSKQSLVQQREVGLHTCGFNKALRVALREDPDVILVGELRDSETVRLALTAAETGHLVLATLHTSSAAKTVNRIVDFFSAEEKDMARAMLAESLQVVIAQVLVKGIQSGRVAAFEIMLATAAIKNLIRENKLFQIPSMLQTGQQFGMCSLQQSLNQLHNQGKIEYAEV